LPPLGAAAEPLPLAVPDELAVAPTPHAARIGTAAAPSATPPAARRNARRLTSVELDDICATSSSLSTAR